MDVDVKEELAFCKKDSHQGYAALVLAEEGVASYAKHNLLQGLGYRINDPTPTKKIAGVSDSSNKVKLMSVFAVLQLKIPRKEFLRSPDHILSWTWSSIKEKATLKSKRYSDSARYNLTKVPHVH